MSLADATHTAELAPRTRQRSILALRYEAWLLDAYPQARSVWLEQLALPRESADPQQQAAFQSRWNEFAVVRAEPLALLGELRDFAVIASRVQTITAEHYAAPSGFDRASLAAAFEEYLNEEAADGWWGKVIAALVPDKKPLSSSAESGADPLPTGGGSPSSSAAP